ncbi:MAG: tRNA 2-thiocytidine biosynthesis TtcA family protein [Sporomusaceae bacterium]|nr:tRNA 2-thiocytidine biosynthesis TtcA family protein [Sporomusaceae bacterium]
MSLPKSYHSRLWRAIIEFDLIEPNDRILIGLSGGKDSCFLTYALAQLRHYSPRPFEIAALTINPNFTDTFDTKALADWCENLAVPFYSVSEPIGEAIARQSDKDACYICATMRRGIMNTFAKEKGFNKIAYAHHHDDAVETFYMSLLFSGQLQTFSPKTYFDRSDITLIRPLVYFREQESRDAISYHGFTPIPSPCPRDGQTKRQTIKQMIAALEKEDPLFYTHLSASMRQSDKIHLWPPEPTRSELKAKHDRFFCKHL